MTLTVSLPQVWYCNPLGQKLRTMNTHTHLSYTRVVNDAGELRITIPEILPDYMIDEDFRIEVWRRITDSTGLFGTSYLDTDTCWFVQDWDYTMVGGRHFTEIQAVSAAHFLERRTIPYKVGTAQTNKTNLAADDMMKSFVTDNLGSGAGTDSTGLARSIATAYFSVQENHGLGPTVSKIADNKSLGQVLREIFADTDTTGTPVFFDVVYKADGTFRFETFIGARGSDHSFPNGNAPAYFSPIRGNINSARKQARNRNGVNAVYLTGKGDGPHEQTAWAVDNTRISKSPFNRREEHIKAPLHMSVALTNEANILLKEKRPRVIYTGEITSTPGLAYGLHWKWGDVITVNFFGTPVNCRIDAVDVLVEAGKETVKAVLRTLV
ncbi:MAG: hypothetical protein NVS9B9_17240 [Ktedonobacteraceae bacterium]